MGSNNIENNFVVQKAKGYADSLGNNNDKIDTAEEIIIFQKTLQTAYVDGKLSDKDFNEAMGLYATTDSLEVENGKRDNFLDQLNNLVENPFEVYSLDELIKQMDIKLGSEKDDCAYVELKQAVQDVLNVVNKYKYESMADVDDKHNQVKKELKKLSGYDKNIYNEILKDIEAQEKRIFVQNASEDILKTYYEVAQENAKEKMSPEDIDQKVSEKIDFKQKGKEYKTARENFRDNQLMQEACNIIDLAVSGCLTETEWRKVKKETIKVLKDMGFNKDKYIKATKKVDTRAVVAGTEKLKEASYINRESAQQARDNNVRKHQIQTEAQIVNQIGGELYAALKSGVVVTADGKEVPAIMKNPDGSYDLSNLQAFIRQYSGAELVVNHYIYAQNREKTIVTNELSLKLNKESITEDDAKKLTELSGIEWGEQSFWQRFATKIIPAALLGAATGAVSAAHAEANRVSLGNVPGETYRVELPNITAEQRTTINEAFGAMGNIKIDVNNVLTVTGDAVFKLKDILVEIPKHVDDAALSAAIPGSIIGAVTGLIIGLLNKEGQGEIPITVLDFEEKTLDEYKDLLRKHSPEYAEALYLLAQTFVKDGNWDKEAYREFLSHTAAGTGSPLNKLELISALKARLKNTVENDTTDKDKKNLGIKKVEVEDTYKDVRTAVTRELEQGKAWIGHIYEYDCLIDLCKNTEIHNAKGQKVSTVNKAIRALKVIQAVDPKELDKYLNDDEKLMQLVQDSYNINKLKDNKDVDCNAFVKVRDAQVIGKIYLPKNLAGCERNSNNYNDPHFTGDQLKGKGPAATTVASYDNTISVLDQSGYVMVKVDGKDTKQFDNRSDANKYIQSVREENSDAIITEIEYTNIDEFNKHIED